VGEEKGYSNQMLSEWARKITLQDGIPPGYRTRWRYDHKERMGGDVVSTSTSTEIRRRGRKFPVRLPETSTLFRREYGLASEHTV